MGVLSDDSGGLVDLVAAAMMTKLEGNYLACACEWRARTRKREQLRVGEAGEAEEVEEQVDGSEPPRG
jgi:hypothetical protein